MDNKNQNKKTHVCLFFSGLGKLFVLLYVALRKDAWTWTWGMLDEKPSPYFKSEKFWYKWSLFVLKKTLHYGLICTDKVSLCTRLPKDYMQTRSGFHMRTTLEAYQCYKSQTKWKMPFTLQSYDFLLQSKGSWKPIFCQLTLDGSLNLILAWLHM